MKWLAIFLLLINAGILFWGLTKEETVITSDKHNAAELGELKILTASDIARLREIAASKVSATTQLSTSQISDISEAGDIPPSRKTETVEITEARDAPGEPDNLDEPETLVETEVLAKTEGIVEEGEGAGDEMALSEVDESQDAMEQPAVVIEPADKLVNVPVPKSLVADDSNSEEVVSAAETFPAVSEENRQSSDAPSGEEKGLSEPDQSEEILTTVADDESVVEADAEIAVEDQQKESDLVIETACKVLGPIEDELIAKSILKELEELEVNTQLRSEPIRRVGGYWVVLPTYNDYPAAIASIKKLKEQGIVDIQRFYRGELKDGVSLGIYNRRFNAEKRKSQIETKGFTPEILPRYTSIPAFWIHYGAVPASDVFERISDRYPALESEDVDCIAELSPQSHRVEIPANRE